MQRISVPSRRKGQTQSTMHPWGRVISTHTLRMEGDRGRYGLHTDSPDFYPHPPRGGRRPDHRLHAGRKPISTHALREEGDAGRELLATSQNVFLPTPSARRATRKVARVLEFIAQFLPTPSARRATHKCLSEKSSFEISTHALREEGDWRQGGCRR